MSPEQTGRMNRALDYRTDFYSLGVTFYELLTGTLPFETTDPLELVHCHIAKQPLPPKKVREQNPPLSPPRRGIRGIREEIPQALSNIVMKLMAKTVEERYQSAWGIKADLEACLNQLQTKGKISEFSLGTEDISDKFHIPQKLYGREVEVETLLAAFDRVADNPQSQIEMMLVAGYSGIGKSSLVAEIHKPNTRLRGYFTEGKFDQFQRNIPYSAIVSAFKGLIQQLLTESSSKLAQWREKLLAAVGSNGQVIIDVIPEVELIVGKQAPVPELGSTESQNRFNRVFSQFIRAFCTKKHPLVIFLDDLQWADSATLKLIELMMTDNETQYLFLIGAYRDNEVSPTHPLTIALEGLKKKGVIVNSITLVPLALESISQLIADTLHSDTKKVNSLAELVKQKTGGNPFFVNQFLKTLHSENLITFHFPECSLIQEESQGEFWQWDIANIKAQDITDNVVELMVGKLKQLPESTQQTLQLAACIGASFNLSTIATVCKKPKHAVAKDLIAGIQDGLVLPISELDDELLIQDYKFLHDRVQQAAYNSLAEKDRIPVHLQIGSLLLANATSDDLSARLFDIVNHLNIGSSLISSESEKLTLARLNLQAGEKAKSAIAYQPAAEYFETAIQLFGNSSWEVDREYTFNLYYQGAESHYLLANFDRCRQLCQVLLERATSVFEKIQVFHLQMVERISQVDHAGSIAIGFEALNLLEIEVPSPEDAPALKQAFQQQMQRYKQLLSDRRIANLKTAPEMSDWRAREIIHVCMRMSDPAILSHPLAFNLIAIIGVNCSLEFGNDPVSALIYVFMGIILIGEFRDYKNACDIAVVGLWLAENKSLSAEITAKTIAYWAWNINHWINPTSMNMDYGDKALQNALEANDILYTGYALIVHPVSLLFMGVPLTEVLNATDRCTSYVVKHQRFFHAALCEQIRRLVFCLQGKTQSPLSFNGGSFDEANYLETWQSMDVIVGHYYMRRLQAFYLFEQYSEVLNLSPLELGQKVPHAYIPSIQFYFYYALTILATLDDPTYPEKPEHSELLKRSRQLFKTCAIQCEANFQSRHCLIEAEMARIERNTDRAILLYDRAIQSAKTYHLTQIEALGNELAAKFWLAKGKTDFATLHLTQACYLYEKWGAIAKVTQLCDKYSHLLSSFSREKRTLSIHATTNASSQPGNILDLASAMKASQAISSEIRLDKLLTKLITILLENTGAQSGFLLLETEGELFIEAEALADGEVTVLQAMPIEFVKPDGEIPLLSSAIINYVLRTQQSLVLDDAMNKGNFTNENYIKKYGVKSVFCVPLLNQGQLNGIVYLENNLTTGAFTPDRLEVIQLLSGQAAIAIENARLYHRLEDYNHTLEEKVEQRTQELQQNNQQLQQTLKKLQRTQAQLIQTEKMFSLGQMVAGMAHEINNPITFIAGNITHAREYFQNLLDLLDLYQAEFPKPSASIENKIEEIELEYLGDDLKKLFDSMQTGSDRIQKIVLGLRNFSRLDESEMKPVDIHEGLDNTLMILQHRLNNPIQLIKIQKNYGKLPRVNCYANQLNQVFLHILSNAIDALNTSSNRQQPEIAIATDIKNAHFVHCSIADNGPGMSEKMCQKVFDPFFTTKPVGKGTGLGLTTSYQIVTEQHQGELRCISQPGKGTKFIIEIPI